MKRFQGIMKTATIYQMHNAFWIVVAKLVADLAVFIFFIILYLRLETIDRQLLIVNGFVLTIAVADIVSLAVIRHGRYQLGIWLAFGALLAIVPLFVVSIADMGVLLGLGIVLITLLGTAPVLPRRQVSGAIIAGLLIGMATILVDVFLTNLSWPANRLVVPQIQTTFYVIAGVLVLIYGFFNLRHFSDYALQTKLIMAFLVVSLFSTGIVGFIADSTIRTRLTETIGRNLKTLATVQARLVGNLLSQEIRALSILALNDSIQEGLQTFYSSAYDDPNERAAIQTILNDLRLKWRRADDTDVLIQSRLNNEIAAELLEFRKAFPAHLEMMITDKYGALVACTSRVADYDQSFQGWWQTAYADGQGAVHMTDPEFETSSGTFVFKIIVPIYAEQTNAVAGILCSHYRLGALSDLLNTVAVEQLGEITQATLFVWMGTARDAGEPAILSGDEPVAVSVNTLNQLRVTESEDHGELDFLGTPSLVSQDWVMTEDVGKEAVARLRWRVATHRPSAETRALIAAQRRDIVLLTLGVLAIAATIALRLARLLATPIKRLTTITARISDGNLTARAPIESSDEVGTLAGAINTMTDQLQAIINTLEARVSERTAELEARTIELNKSKEAAEAANAAKSDFLARMSHEIRTPLNAVIGLTNMVLKSELTVEQRDYLIKVQMASDNLLAVINDILDFSKIEAGRLELEQHPFDLDQIMELLVDLFRDQTAEKDVELIFAVNPNVPRQLTGDGDRLAQVLINLIQNAVKFTESGEIVLGVEQEAPLPKDQAQAAFKFWVRDTGTGIAADVLPTLFEPFTQAEGYLTRKHEGSGLGLAICRRLVELMDGRIWADSTPGQGSTFSFTVMLASQKEERPRFCLPVDLHGLKALVVDDNATARQALGGLLESFDFNVSAVDSGEKAIEALDRAESREPYQLVLMDWKMPGMDGIETAAAIRNNPDLHCPPIIMVTAYERELAQKRMDNTSMDTLLLKPVKPSQLFNAIMKLFGQAEAMAPRREQKPAALPIHRLAGRRVLVVEDSELNRDVAVALLEEAGMAAEVAENGQIAVDKVTESPRGYYDAVLMDIQMPVMDGYEATRKIREFENQQEAAAERPENKTPIIALTAHALKGEKEKCLSADMDDYLAKPLDEKELHRVLLKWIAAQQ